MNILLLQNNLNQTCGVTKSILNLVDSFEKYPGYNFFLIVKKNNIGNLELRHNFKKVFVYNSPKILFVFILFFFIKKNKINLVHSHHRFYDLIAHFISKFSSVKTVITVHSKVFGYRQFSYKSNKIIAVSKAISDHLINEFNVKRSKISVIPNSINIDSKEITIEKETLLKELKIQNNNRIIGYIGRIDIREKGIDILMNAFELIKNENLILLLVGKGDDEKFVKEFIKKNKSKIILVPETDIIYDYYNLLDIFILPSRSESFGIVLLEAGLMRLPVIASNVDGIPEMVEDKINGLLFESENSDELAKKIQFLLENNAIGKRLGENLYNKVIENYTDKKNVKKIEELYLKIYNS